MPTTLAVSSRSTVRVLMESVDKLESRGDSAEAALIANELVARLSDADPKQAAHYEIIAYIGAAKSLHVDVATYGDPQQGKTVMAPDLKLKVAGFQVEQGIYSSTDKRLGNLDYRTLSTMAGKSLSTTLEDLRSVGPQ
jgi:hypothetical protein